MSTIATLNTQKRHTIGGALVCYGGGMKPRRSGDGGTSALRVSVPMTLEERTELQRRAKAAGVTVAEYVRVACLEAPPLKVERKVVPASER